MIDNAGNTLTFAGSTGSVEIDSIPINNGVVDFPSTVVLRDVTLTDVTLASDITGTEHLDIQDVNADGNTINLFGQPHSASASALAVFPDDLTNSSVTLSNANVNLGGGPNSSGGGYLIGLSNTAIPLTIDAATVVRGFGGVGFQLGGGPTDPLVTNQGVITASVSRQTLHVANAQAVFGSALTNTGTLQASNGGVLDIDPSFISAFDGWTNNGSLTIDDISSIQIDQGLTLAAGSALNLSLGNNGSSGLLSIDGGINIQNGAALNLALDPGTSFSGPYEIATYTAGDLLGAFSQVTPGFVVDYSHPGEILVTAIPEPASDVIGAVVAVYILTRRRSGRSKRRAFALLASAAVAGLVSARAGASEITSTWSGNTGDWTDATQWSTNSDYPNNGTPSGVSYDALINAPGAGAYTVSLSTSITTDSVTLSSPNATISQTGGTLDTSALDITTGSYSLTGGVIENALITDSGGTFTATGNAGGLGSPNTFSNVGLGSDLSVFGGLNIQNGINFNGHAITYRSGGGNPISYLDFQLNGAPYTLSNATILLVDNGSGINCSAGSSLTFANSTTIEGSGTIDLPGDNETLINQGTITGTTTTAESILHIGAASFINRGTLQALGGNVTIQPASAQPPSATNWTNNGILAIDTSGNIVTLGSLQFADGSAFNAMLGSAGQSGKLTIEGNLDLSHDESLNLSMAPGASFSGAYDVISYNGALTGMFAYVTPGFVVDYSQPGEILVTAVPEPASASLLATGLWFALSRRLRKRMKQGSTTSSVQLKVVQLKVTRTFASRWRHI